jgi:hypothetical protein
MRKSLLAYLLLHAVALLLTASAQQQPDTSSRISELNWFSGNWTCAGKFTSGKSISAKVSFESTLDGKWILFRHDDDPPFKYHALSEWGWEKKSQRFLSLIQDSTGGVRAFYSPGWDGAKLLWEGGALSSEQPSSERFEFTRLDDSAFQVSYSYRKNEDWVSVDTSRCIRVKAKP